MSLSFLGPVIAAGSWLLLQHMGRGGNAAGPSWTTAGLIAVLAWSLLQLSGRFRAPTAPRLTRDASGNPISSVDTHFSESYWEAREKFRRAAEAVPGCELHTLNVTGPSYTTDIAVLPGTGDGLVVHLSGVHGVEGYAGSAVQLALLSKLATRSPRDEGSPTVIVVHAVNPFGMAHFRRFNENNVDLNRNALTPEGLQEMLARDPNIAGYFDFAPMFNPPSGPTLFDAYVLFPFRAIYHILRYGTVHMKRAIVAAQYNDPQGIYFGGRELQPSWRLLWEFLEPYQDKKVVTVVDVHTGLGTTGEDTLLTQADVAAMQRWFPDAPKVQNEQAGQGDVGAGYELTRGFSSELLGHRFVADQVQILQLTQEFGTVAMPLVARGMILENQAFQHAPAEQAYWSTFSRDAFYVRTAKWKHSIVKRGLRVAMQAVERSASLSR